MSIHTAINLGQDQMTSQFLIIFPNGIPGGGDSVTLPLRMDQDFDIPERVVGTYEFFFQGLKIIRTSTVEQTDKRFTLSFRLDQNWDVWKALNDWFALVYDEENGTFTDDAETRVPLLMQAFGANKVPVQQLTFEGAQLVGLKPTTFSNGGEDPSRIEANFIYHKFTSLI